MNTMNINTRNNQIEIQNRLELIDLQDQIKKLQLQITSLDDELKSTKQKLIKTTALTISLYNYKNKYYSLRHTTNQQITRYKLYISNLISNFNILYDGLSGIESHFNINSRYIIKEIKVFIKNILTNYKGEKI